MKYKLAILPGDGIGSEVTDAAVRVLEALTDKVETTSYLFGGASCDVNNTPLTDEVLRECASSDAVLLGAVGGPKWDSLPSEIRPEKGLLKIRKELGLFCNLRPALLYEELTSSCPLKPELVEGGLDIMIVRELTGGAYFGPKELKDDYGSDLIIYSEKEVERIAIKAFEIAKKRKNKLTSVDKANVLMSSKLWRKVVDRVALDYPEVEVEHMYVDNAAMQLVTKPKQFDLILTENMFGDILSDEASVLTGSIGMLPSASLRDDSFGLYEPSHGSAPQIAGQNIVNPIACILSLALALRYSFKMTAEADRIEKAITKVLQDGYRTLDIEAEGTTVLGTKEITSLIIKAL